MRSGGVTKGTSGMGGRRGSCDDVVSVATRLGAKAAPLVRKW
jgi:hypothetical protein